MKMFLTLLIVTQAVAEWVEISQQHYRKPMHTYSIHNPFTTPDRVKFEETTESWIYKNASVSEYNWNKGSKIPSDIGNIKRVQSKGALKSAEAVRLQKDKSSNLDGDEVDLRTNYGPAKPTVDFGKNDKQKGIIEKVPNIGNLKQVQLSNTPVKSPVVNFKTDTETVAKNRYEELPLNNEQSLGLLGPNKISDKKSNKRRIYINNLRNQINTERTNTFPEDEEEVFTTETQVSRKRPNPELKDNINLPKISRKTYTTQTEDFIQNGKNEDRFQKVDHSKVSGVTEKKQIFTTPASNIDESTVIKHNKDLPKQSTKQTNKNYESKIPSDKMNEFSKRRPLNNIPQTEYNENRIEVLNSDRRIFKKGDKPVINGNSSIENEINDRNIEHQRNENINQDGQKGITSNGTKPENKIGNMENLLKIMKVVTDTISQNTRRSFGGKMRYLHELKDSILDNIAARIDATWPDDEVTVPHRRSRSAQASPRGHHVQFPSSESALMTISFLTFAVFLIKLVLQIIHTYKNKSMMVTPLMVAAAGRTVLTHHGHH